MVYPTVQHDRTADGRAVSFVLLFFQAEDGIRDLTVTGVSDVCSSDLRDGGSQVKSQTRCKKTHWFSLPRGPTRGAVRQTRRARASEGVVKDLSAKGPTSKE